MTGDHVDGKTNDDVTIFDSSNNSFNCFPKNLDKYFKNLDRLFFSHANISTVTRGYLQPFGSKLEYFVFDNNQIEVIPADLFVDMPNLKYIILRSNKIKFVGRGAFSSIEQLILIVFQNNPCFSGSGFMHNEIETVIKGAYDNCTDQEAFTRYKNGLLSSKEEEIH